MYFGEFTVKLDDKGRLTVPRRLRQVMEVQGDAIWYMTRGFDGCVALYPRYEWNRIKEQVQRFPSMNAQALVLRRMLFSSMSEGRLDGQGRMGLPSHLRELGAIDVEDEMALVGVGDHIEIWNKENWRSFQAGNESAYKEMATLLSMGEGLPGLSRESHSGNTDGAVPGEGR